MDNTEEVTMETTQEEEVGTSTKPEVESISPLRDTIRRMQPPTPEELEKMHKEKEEKSETDEPEKANEADDKVEEASNEDELGIDLEFIKDLDEKEIERFKKMDGKEAIKELVIQANEAKKVKRIAEERKLKLEKLDPENVEKRLGKYENFIEEMRKDVRGAYNRYRKDFDLPEEVFVVQQFAGNSVENRLKQWQTAELIPTIEKKHKLDEGTFVYDNEEAYEAGTPSYDYRRMTVQKETELFGEAEKNKIQQQKAFERIKEQTDADMKFIKDTYFPDEDYESEEEAHKAVQEALGKIDAMQTKIGTGEFSSEENPFSIRNVFRGVFFEELVGKAVKKAVEEVHKAYHDKGLYISDDDNVTDVTKVKGESIQRKPVTKTNSPLRRSIARYNNN